jgi:DNA-binding transcriptional regulator GbsR (MarR family)
VATVDREAGQQYAEEFGLLYSKVGMPPAFGRLLGWLMICEPAEQTSSELAEALHLSRGSVSTGMRMLEGAKLARRVARPGLREHAYEMLPDGLITGTMNGKAIWSALSDQLAKGVELIGGDDVPEAQRARIARDFFAFIAERVPALIDEFKRDNGL